MAQHEDTFEMRVIARYNLAQHGGVQTIEVSIFFFHYLAVLVTAALTGSFSGVSCFHVWAGYKGESHSPMSAYRSSVSTLLVTCTLCSRAALSSCVFNQLECTLIARVQQGADALLFLVIVKHLLPNSV